MTKKTLKNFLLQIKPDRWDCDILCEMIDNLTDEDIMGLLSENISCDGCKHLSSREENLKHSCLIEVCRTCSRNNNDNWEQK